MDTYTPGMPSPVSIATSTNIRSGPSSHVPQLDEQKGYPEPTVRAQHGEQVVDDEKPQQHPARPLRRAELSGSGAHGRLGDLGEIVEHKGEEDAHADEVSGARQQG